MDDYVFPSYSTAKTRSKHTQFGESKWSILLPFPLPKSSHDIAGDAFVRELDFSKIQIRLKEKQDKKGENDAEDIIAKLRGDTLDVLRKCLVSIALK